MSNFHEKGANIYLSNFKSVKSSKLENGELKVFVAFVSHIIN